MGGASKEQRVEMQVLAIPMELFSNVRMLKFSTLQGRNSPSLKYKHYERMEVPSLLGKQSL